MRIVMIPDEGLEHPISLLLRDPRIEVLVRQIVEVVVADDSNEGFVCPEIKDQWSIL